MGPKNSLVCKTFKRLEVFFQQVAALDIFETLIFNYKIKIDLQDPILINFLTFVTEFVNQLKLVTQESLSKGNWTNAHPISNLDTEFNEKGLAAVPSSNGNKSSLKDESKTDSEQQGTMNQSCILRTCVQKKSHIQDVPKDDDEAMKCSRETKPHSFYNCSCESNLPDSDEEEADDWWNSPGRIATPPPNPVEPPSSPESSEDDVELPCYCCNVCHVVYAELAEFDDHVCKRTISKPRKPPAKKSRVDQNLEVQNETPGSRLIGSLRLLRSLAMYRCGICSEEYRSWGRILYHLPRCTRGPYQCELCPTKFPCKVELSLHKKKMHRGRECFFCEECGLSFKFRTSLQKHKVNRHEREVSEFACRECDSTFHKKVQLTNHRIRDHSAQREFLCQVCGSVLSNERSLTSHLEMHSEVDLRRFFCDECGHGFRKKEKLILHTRKHTGARPHPCLLCDKHFRRKEHLNAHMRYHRGEKKYRCEPCNKAFATNWYLNHHNRKHHVPGGAPKTTAKPPWAPQPHSPASVVPPTLARNLMMQLNHPLGINQPNPYVLGMNQANIGRAMARPHDDGMGQSEPCILNVEQVPGHSHPAQDSHDRAGNDRLMLQLDQVLQNPPDVNSLLRKGTSLTPEQDRILALHLKGQQQVNMMNGPFQGPQQVNGPPNGDEILLHLNSAGHVEPGSGIMLQAANPTMVGDGNQRILVTLDHAQQVPLFVPQDSLPLGPLLVDDVTGLHYIQVSDQPTPAQGLTLQLEPGTMFHIPY